MSALFDAARELQTLLEMRGWGFCFIGGLAVLRWGAARPFLRGELTSPLQRRFSRS
jgi:hypothetical protein